VELADAAKGADVLLEPLVWLFTNKGEHWSIAACVVDCTGRTPSYVSSFTSYLMLLAKNRSESCRYGTDESHDGSERCNYF